MVRKAVIPCAGFGTRFLPETKVIPKEAFPIVDTPNLEYIIKEAEDSGIEDILIILSPQKKIIETYFETNEVLNRDLLLHDKKKEYQLANKKYKANIQFAIQEKMDGNGNAVLLAEKFANGEPFAVLFGDDLMYTADKTPVTKQLADAYDKTGKIVVGCQVTSDEVARRCAVMIPQEKVDDKITLISGLIEKPTQKDLPSDLVSLGRFVLDSTIFDYIRNTPANFEGEVYLTHAINKLANEKGACACLFDARRYDIGNKEGFLEAVVDYALRNDEVKEQFSKYLKNLNL